MGSPSLHPNYNNGNAMFLCNGQFPIFLHANKLCETVSSRYSGIRVVAAIRWLAGVDEILIPGFYNMLKKVFFSMNGS